MPKYLFILLSCLYACQNKTSEKTARGYELACLKQKSENPSLYTKDVCQTKQRIAYFPQDSALYYILPRNRIVLSDADPQLFDCIYCNSNNQSFFFVQNASFHPPSVARWSSSQFYPILDSNTELLRTGQKSDLFFFPSQFLSEYINQAYQLQPPTELEFQNLVNFMLSTHEYRKIEALHPEQLKKIQEQLMQNSKHKIFPQNDFVARSKAFLYFYKKSKEQKPRQRTILYPLFFHFYDNTNKSERKKQEKSLLFFCLEAQNINTQAQPLWVYSIYNEAWDINGYMRLFFTD